MTKPSIYLLCRQGSEYGAMILQASERVGVKIDGILLQEWTIMNQIRRYRYYAKKSGYLRIATTRVVDFIDRRFIAARSGEVISLNKEIESKGLRVHQFPNLNGEEMLKCLDTIQPAIILIGGVGKLSQQVLDKVSIGVINAHPGSLPKYRGNYVIRWAILANDPIFISVHLVDEGLDTGGLLLDHRIDIPEYRSLNDIEHWVDQRRAELLIETLIKWIDGKILPCPQAEMAAGIYSFQDIKSLLRTYWIIMHGRTAPIQ